MSQAAKIRLYLDQPLAKAQTLSLERDQANYLFAVMRLSVGAEILVFNGRDGEFLAEVVEANKRAGRLLFREQTRAVQLPPDLWLIFAPIKKARTDFIVEKATEMGAARIIPVQTEFTNSERIRQDRLQAHAIEAAEQCGGTFVPEVSDLMRLDRLLAQWPEDRQIIWADEARVGVAAAFAGPQHSQKWALLIGPEGGFSPQERVSLSRLPFVTPVSLGPRILRADTAAVALLTLFQSHLGDWHDPT